MSSNKDMAMANTSGNFLFLKKRKTGNKTMLMKNAINIGASTLCPTTISAPSINNPNNSIDLLTVSGNSFISFKLSIKEWLNKTRPYLLP